MKENKIKVKENWYNFARDDYKIVKTLFHQKDKIHRGICFHAQQYVEKILKGILEENNIKPPKTHDVVYLKELCDKLGITVPIKEDQLQLIASVYIDVRYPPDVGLMPDGEPTEEHSELAYEIVNKLNGKVEKSREEQE